MLEQIFLKVVDMSLSASLVIGIVCLIRFVLRRFPKYLSYMLWSVVLFRLLCPVALEAEIGIVPDIKPIFHAFFSEKSGKGAVLAEASGEMIVSGHHDEAEDGLSGTMMVGVGREAENEKDAEAFWQEGFLLYGRYVWILGMGVLLSYCVISVIKLRKRVMVSIPLRENIFLADETISPFAMGFFRPRIYLPEGLGEEEQEYIILHEKVHIRRLDHIIKPLAFATLCIHWFNPLVWLAFLLFCKDMEMSCDEAVIKKLGEGIRADYSASLLALSTQRRTFQGVPVDFGEGDTKGRVRNLAAFRRTKRWVSAVLGIGIAILMVCLAFTRRTVASDIIREGWQMFSGASIHSFDAMKAASSREIADKTAESTARKIPDKAAESAVPSLEDIDFQEDKAYIYYIHEDEIRKWNKATGEEQPLYQSDGLLQCIDQYKDYLYFIEAIEENNEHRLCSISKDGENFMITRLAPINFKTYSGVSAVADPSEETGMSRELLFADMVENVSNLYGNQEDDSVESHDDFIVVYRQGKTLEIRVNDLKTGRRLSE